MRRWIGWNRKRQIKMNNALPLKIGSSGAFVAKWQRFLIQSGFKKVAEDGKFGPLTELATKQFQSLRGLVSDGIVGEATWSLLDSSGQIVDSAFSKWPKQDYKSMVEFYGEVGENQTQIILPYKFKLAWDKNTELKKITCHKLVADSLLNILESTLSAYGIKRIIELRLDLFGGCLNVRRMRGGSSWSMHSWGAAVDIDPDNNQLRWNKSRATLAGKDYYQFWQIVEENGWTSLGRQRGYDWMHFQAANL